MGAGSDGRRRAFQLLRVVVRPKTNGNDVNLLKRKLEIDQKAFCRRLWVE